jgi:hypothetical protein
VSALTPMPSFSKRLPPMPRLSTAIYGIDYLCTIDSGE